MTPRGGVVLTGPMAPLIGIESSRRDGGWVSWSLLGAWLAAVVLVVPAGAEEFSLSRCLAGGGQGGQIDLTRHFACFEAQRANEVRRYKEAAAERERQRQAAEEATRQQAGAQAQETADRAARARQEAERARKAEAVERARKAEAVERERKAAEEVEAARRTEARQAAQRSRPAAEQFMPGTCPQPDLTAKCAMPQDPVLEQIRKSQENAAKGRPSR
jgi:flagellar biosynthesis GTPase FlhF